MAQSRVGGVTATLADLTDRSEDELRLALTVAAAVTALIAGLRLINYLGGLGGGSRPHRAR